MTAFATQSYNMLLHNLLLSITPMPAAAPTGKRGDVGTPEKIPERCFIVDTVTAADGFKTKKDRDGFNGFIKDGNQYHKNFGLPITRVKSFAQILEFYKKPPSAVADAPAADIGRIRIVTHGMFDWMQFPLFPGGDFGIGITSEHLDAFQTSDEEGLRWTLTKSTNSPMFQGITSAIVDGMRQVNSSLLAPVKLDAPGSPLAGDVKLFLDNLADRYCLKYGTIVTNPTATTFALLNATQQSRLTAALDSIDMEIRKRLKAAPATSVVTKPDLDALEAAILAASPGKLRLIGAKKTLPADILKPASTAGSLAAAMAASPKDEDDLRTAISGGTSNLMFSNRTGEILAGLSRFHNAKLSLGGGVVISQWSDIQKVQNLEDFFFVCNDLYMAKKGEFKIAGGGDLTDAQRPQLSAGLVAISEIIAKKIAGPSTSRLRALRTAIENLSFQESDATGNAKSVDARSFPELHAAVKGLNAGFRSNLNTVRARMKVDSAVDIRGCKIGSDLPYLDKMRNFLGGSPTVSAPQWWQSYPTGVQARQGTQPEKIFPEIDGVVRDGIKASNITSVDVAAAFTLWKGLLNFKPHYDFVTALFANSDGDRLRFAAREWRTWQVGGAGPGIPVLNMPAQRMDDVATIDVDEILERFRLIFEIPTADGLTPTQRSTMKALRPILLRFKALKTTIDAATAPTAPEISTFYTKLGTVGTDIDAIAGTTAPGTLLPPGAQTPDKLKVYASNVENYIFANLRALLDPFFAKIRAELTGPNSEIRYYCNIGLVLPIQSSSHPTITNPAVMISFKPGDRFVDRRRMLMDALRGWMKVQWKGASALESKMNAHIDSIPLPGSFAAISEFARRSAVSDGNPSGDPKDLASHYCPLDEFAGKMAAVP